MRRTLGASLVLLGGAACAPSVVRLSETEGRMETTKAARPSVILMVLDGVRWQDVFRGTDPELAERFRVPSAERLTAPALLPNLHRMMSVDGAALGGGEPAMEASGPNFVSLPGYMEMLTGRRETGCTTNQCGRVRFATVADEVARLGGVATVVTSWPDIGFAATAFPGAITGSVGRRGGFQRHVLESDPAVTPLLRAGELAAPHPGHGDFRPDGDTATVALSHFESREPDFLFVALGESDEYGHRDDYRGYLRALRLADSFVGRFAEVARRRTSRGHPTTLLVTTDHGRARTFSSHGMQHPESRRVWLVAAGAGIEARGHVPSPRARRLADVAPTIRALLGLPAVEAKAAGEPLVELLSTL